MEFLPLPTYFIVKINKKQQQERKEKIGSLYLHFNEVQMQRNMQHGEIVAIGSEAGKALPQAKIGDTLIFHHFVEGSHKDKSNFIISDNDYNYYNVTTSEFNGHRNETYGVYNGQEIIPHPDFIFIEAEPEKEKLSMDEYIEKSTKKVGSLYVFTNWEESREDKEAKATRLKEEIKSLSKSSMNDQIKRGIEEKEYEAAKVTSSLNEAIYKKYKVCYHNPKMKSKEFVYALSRTALTHIDFMDKRYIVMQSKYCEATC